MPGMTERHGDRWVGGLEETWALQSAEKKVLVAVRG